MTDVAKLPMFVRVRDRLHAFAHSLLSAHVSPPRLAAAVFIGAIVGCTPLFGMHLSLCIALAWLFRLNQATVYAAANISIPPLVPLIGFASVQIGERILHHRFLTLRPGDFRAADLDLMAIRFFLDWLLGGVLLGAGIGALMAAGVYTAARRYKTEPLPIGEDLVAVAIRMASRRYEVLPAQLRLYARFKYRLDPCYARIASLVPDGTLTVDLGTGLGMLPLVLRLLPGARRVIGVDWDRMKVDAGRTATAGLDDIELVEGDLRSHPIPPCDVITIVDVLHYYPPPVQRALLLRCCEALRPSGLLFVREGDARCLGGARVTRAMEALAVRFGWNRAGGAENFRAADELCAELERFGMTVTVETAAGRFHPGNVLLCAQRRSA